MTAAVITTIIGMGRWQPDAMGRLQRAALELYRDRGYDQTTVAEIADRAELTERTFFRYFADKREVLFGGSDLLEQRLLDALAATDPASPPLEQVAAALVTAGEVFADRATSRLRHEVISAHAELQERELMKLARLGAAIADTLRQRGVADPLATLSAEAGIAVFKVAFERWIAKAEKRSYDVLFRDSFAELKAAAMN
jgi:AcrR family transcriptional regulator